MTNDINLDKIRYVELLKKEEIFKFIYYNIHCDIVG